MARWCLLPTTNDLLDLLTYRVERDAKGFQRLGSYPIALVNEAQQNVLGANVVVIEQPGFFLGEDNHPAGPVGEPLEHGTLLLSAGYRQSFPRGDRKSVVVGEEG